MPGPQNPPPTKRREKLYLGDTPRPSPKGRCPSGLPFFNTLLKAALIETLGEIGKWVEAQATQIVPVVFPHFLDPVSPHVRAASARACRDLTDWNRDLLPEDVLLILASLLHDQWLHPVVCNVIQVFERARVADAALAREIVVQIALMERAYGMDVSQDSLLPQHNQFS